MLLGSRGCTRVRCRARRAQRPGVSRGRAAPVVRFGSRAHPRVGCTSVGLTCAPAGRSVPGSCAARRLHVGVVIGCCSGRGSCFRGRAACAGQRVAGDRTARTAVSQRGVSAGCRRQRSAMSQQALGRRRGSPVALSALRGAVDRRGVSCCGRVVSGSWLLQLSDATCCRVRRSGRFRLTGVRRHDRALLRRVSLAAVLSQMQRAACMAASCPKTRRADGFCRSCDDAGPFARYPSRHASFSPTAHPNGECWMAGERGPRGRVLSVSLLLFAWPEPRGGEPGSGRCPAPNLPSLYQRVKERRDLEYDGAAAHQYTGRGPTKARTLVHDDIVSVVLQDTSPRASARSSRATRQPAAADTLDLQDVVGDDLIAGVERSSDAG